jgi:hypothetical protein
METGPGKLLQPGSLSERNAKALQSSRKRPEI